MKWFFVLISALSSTCSYAGNEMTADELDKWFEEEKIISTDHVSEGELRFLTTPPDKPALHSLNKIEISPQSIESGWVNLNQCYKNLDAVPDAEVVYLYKSMRNLKIVNSHNIEHAKIKDQSVQLLNVKKNAEICITAEVRILYKNPNGTFSLVNGPYHRKFLDGYFPYHITLDVHFPSAHLTFLKSIPTAQKGYSVKTSNQHIKIDSVFEGILNTEIIFSRNNKR